MRSTRSHPAGGGGTAPRGTVGRRGTASVVGAVVLLAVTVVGAAVVGSLALSAVPDAGTPPVADLSLSVDGDRITITHRGGATLDVRDLRVRVRVDDRPLASQPPVPFFSATGFRPGPHGPFNSAADPTWTAGEVGSFRVAATNEPRVTAGARVTVEVFAGDRPVARLTDTA